MVFCVAYCPFFSGNSALVLVLILRARKSEGIPTAKYSKSQKQNIFSIKFSMHVFYATNFYLHFHIPSFLSHLKAQNQMLYLNRYLILCSLLRP